MTSKQTAAGLVIGGSYYDGAHPCNPREAINQNMPLWCVYGADCFPMLICCKISTRPSQPVVWGFSVYQGKPGFRTLGVYLDQFLKEHPEARFYRVQKDALAWIAGLTAPNTESV